MWNLSFAQGHAQFEERQEAERERQRVKTLRDARVKAADSLLLRCRTHTRAVALTQAEVLDLVRVLTAD
jgi:hypothetical protein